MSEGLWIAIAIVAVLVVTALVVGFVRYRRSRISLSAPEETPELDRSGGYTASSGITFSSSDTAEKLPTVGDDAEIPRDSRKRTIADVQLPEPELAAPEVVAEPDVVTERPEVVAEPEPTAAPEPEAEPEPEPEPELEVAPRDEIAPTAGRLERLRGRLAKSQTTLGRSMLGLLGGGDLDEDSWESIEDTLLIADLGPVATESIVTALRSRMAEANVRTEADVRAVVREVLIKELRTDLDRSIKALPHADKPSVLLVVGVNGAGKTTTVGKLARVLVADGRRVVLGAADTFRAAAADQLQSWGARVGADTVRGPEGADPASVAFDAVDTGIAAGADVVVVDTAGRLHTKTGLMDELGKVKRVVEKRAKVDEVLLVLDATIGQNSLPQARVFAEVVDITGVVLTKLDGTAKGGIVFRVQQELGVPVKLVGLGEGPDDLAPFEPAAFVDALLG
ncbi:signal recognition particle-docking protein FtsY [Mycolicibacterium phocaicum]|uniref:Signal recognition particle receptor FtsY n=1 Tax=Mycolicibacterium phocaicum TaxID=319706 RepID=A0A7I7ZJV4_9MYCO|nr:signal recognition particle-docking protein FtsY [Mycolicibacterium phocaicum]TLH69877.1 signal recognition particle-docking protein FtsY [Mycolicibacterium phocaicum]BBZ54486.1 signal recognition particle receptor FtsY [Mycolicibacterium phocaicum]